MSSTAVDLFVEDQAHEEFLKAMVQRLGQEEGLDVQLRVRAARGGHGRALAEFANYQKLLEKGIMTAPDLVVVAIDANCKAWNQARKDIEAHVALSLRRKTVIACPDPHIERWYLADPVSFYEAVGYQPRPGKKKCERGLYKRILTKAIREAGHTPTLGGIEFAQELVAAMNLYRIARNDRALGAFIDQMRGVLRGISQSAAL